MEGGRDSTSYLLFSIHRVKEAAAGGDSSSRWEPESSGDDEEEFLSDEQKQHKKEFREWRKNHYNEFMAVKRARELMKQVHPCIVKLC